jgi:hypothetical protein
MRIFFIIFLALVSSELQAEERYNEYEFYNEHIKIDKNYLAERVVEYKFNIRNTQGLDESIYHTTYDSLLYEYKIIDAYLEKGKEIIRIPQESIQIEEVKNAKRGTEEKRKIISFKYPGAVIGDKIYVKTIKRMIKPHDTLAISFQRDLNRDVIYKNFKFKIESDIQFDFQLLNVDNKFIKSKSIKENSVEIILKNFFLERLDEKNQFESADELPSIIFTTKNAFQIIHETFIKKLESVIAKSQIPKDLLSKADDSLKKNEDPIKSLANFVSTHITYYQSYNRDGSSSIPRPLNEIWNDKSGDCKDVSFLLMTLLRRKGIDAHLGFISRGRMDNYVKWFDRVEMDNFDHMVVVVKNDNQYVVVDATTTIVEYPHIPSDLQFRPLLVMAEKPIKVFVENSSTKDLAHYRYEVEKNKILLKINGTFDRLYSPVLKLLKGHNFANELYEILSSSIYGNVVDISKVKINDLKDRALIAFSVQYQLSWENNLLNDRRYFKYEPGFSSILAIDSKMRKSSYFLSGSLESETFEVVGVKDFMGLKNKKCTVENDYLSHSLEIAIKDNSLKIIPEYKSKSRYMPLKYIKSKEFEKFQKDYAKCFSPIMAFID